MCLEFTDKISIFAAFKQRDFYKQEKLKAVFVFIFFAVLLRKIASKLRPRWGSLKRSPRSTRWFRG